MDPDLTQDILVEPILPERPEDLHDFPMLLTYLI